MEETACKVRCHYHRRRENLYTARYCSFFWKCIPAFMDGDAVLTTHRFAVRVNHPNLSLNALSEAHRLTVGDVNHPARATHAHAHQCEQANRA
jgi:hypothetical protein